MRIERLWAHAFRNLRPLSIEAEAPALVLVGDNAQGKTNVLEAIYLCATGRSFRQAAARELLQHGAGRARLQALFSRQNVRHEVAMDYGPGPAGAVRQKARMDGRALRQLSQLLQLVNVVAFFPEDLGVVKGSPEVRRRFFDRAVAGGRPAFVEASVGYHRALRSRNALLRAPSPPPRALLAPYDAQLVRFGAVVHAARVEALRELSPEARALFGQLMPQHALRLGYLSGVQGVAEASAATPDDEVASFATRFAQALVAGYPRDRARGATHAGPHRADLHLAVDGHEARPFASQGQQRAVVLALKIAELGCSRRRLGTPPILLLDDVSSELDADRTAALFAAVAQLGCQTWLTTTGSVELPLVGERQLFDVRAGEVLLRQTRSG